MKNDTSTEARQLARAITDYGTDIEQLAIETPRAVIVTAIAGYEQSLTPMREVQLAARADDIKTLSRAIGAIGNRIRPDFTPEQSQAWTASMVDALDQYPARIAIMAARDAKADPIRFPADVLEAIQARAERHLQSYRARLNRLRRMLRIHDHPPLLADERKAEARRMSDEDLQDMPQELRQLGLAAGFLTECEDGSIRWADEDEQDAHRAAKRERLSRAREARG